MAVAPLAKAVLNLRADKLSRVRTFACLVKLSYVTT